MRLMTEILRSLSAVSLAMFAAAPGCLTPAAAQVQSRSAATAKVPINGDRPIPPNRKLVSNRAPAKVTVRPRSFLRSRQ